MSRQTKRNSLEIPLQPWAHQQQPNTSADAQAPFSRESISGHPSSQRNEVYKGLPSSPTLKQASPNHKQQRRSYSPRNVSRESRKYATIDYVKKNQKSLQSYSLFSPNYAALLSDDADAFMPINPNASNANEVQYNRRPSINTTYIGYYDQQPFTVDSNPSNTRPRKDIIKHWSSESKSRPKTTDFGLRNISKNMIKGLPHEIDDIKLCQHFSEKTSYTVGNYHLQKILKIKEKLRQKLKRNSEKRDNERGAHLKNTIKIEQQQIKPRTIDTQNNFCYPTHGSKNGSYGSSKISSAFPSRKNSINSIESQQKQRKRVDKWKQYLKMQNQQRQQKQTQNISRQTMQKKNRKFLGVVGGAIYK